MNKILKFSLIGIGGLLALLLVTIGYIAATFNPNDYKPLIVKIVKEKKQRTLNIEGDIKLAFWPKLGADLGKISISEHNGDKEFASMQNAKVFVAVLPLLNKQLVVDTVRVDDVHANIVRFKDGTTNFDDLLSKEESGEIKFDIDGVVVTNASVSLTDEQGNRHLSIADMELKTGHVAKNQPMDLQTSFTIKGDNPKLDAKIQAKGVLLADTENKHYSAHGLDVALQGAVATATGLDLKFTGDLDAKPDVGEFLLDGLKLDAKASMNGKALLLALDAPKLEAKKDEVSSKEVHLSFSQASGDDHLAAKLTIANLKGSPKAFQSSGINGEISGKQGARTIAGKFASPFSGDLENMVFDLPKLAGDVDVKDPALPGGAMKATFNIGAHADTKKELANIGLNATVDSSKLKGNVDITGFAKPNVKFNLTADRLDLDKLLGKAPENQDKQQEPAQKAAAKPADLSALKNVLAQGTLNIDAINYGKYRIANLALSLKADGQMLSINPFSAKLDDSTIKGNLGISHFDKPLYNFDLDIDHIDADRYMAADGGKPVEAGAAKPLDLSALKALNAVGSLRIGSVKYGKTQSSNVRIDLKGDGQKLDVDPFSAKLDDSQIRASLGITRFENPVFSFNVDIDKLDADRYLTKQQPAAKSTGDTPIDLSALKALHANGNAKLGWLKLANVKTTNVKITLKAEAGQVALSPFSADLYQGSMSGSLDVDARATPAVTFKQDMKAVAVGPLLIDAINNDMLEGKGTVNVDIKTQGATVGALKKAINGNAALLLADGAVKGIDIAGTIRDIKSKFNFKGNNLGADQKKRTDFSEMSASFKIANGVAHNDDLSMKSPLLRVAGSGDIDIGSEKINYVAKPTVVASLKGQGGSDIGTLNGLTFPVKVTGTFSDPKYGLDFAAIGTAIAQKSILEKVGGSKGEALQKVLSGDKAGALEGLIGGKSAPAPSTPTTAPSTTPTTAPTTQPAPQEAPTPEQKVKKKLNKLLGL